MQATPSSSSEHYRIQGNEHYRLAKSQSTRQVGQRRSRLWSALDCYKSGLTTGNATPKDRSLCLKNSAIAHKELCTLEWTEGHKARAWSHLHDSLEAYSRSWRDGSTWIGAAGSEGRHWSARFVQQFSTDLRTMYSLTLSEATDESLADNLGRVCSVVGLYDFDDPEYLQVAGNVLVDYANRLLRVSVSLDKRLNYGQAYRHIAMMNFPIKEADRLLRRNAAAFDCMERELAVLAEDQRIQEVIFHSRVELERGKAFLANLGDQGTEQIIHEALIAMDYLRAALNLVSDEGIDIVLEAEVCSSIGQLYLSYFCAEKHAEKYLKRCVELILCYIPGDRNIGCRSETWYEAAERGLRTLQERRAKRRDEERLKELEADGTLADIKANYERGSEHFLEHIYKKYPPQSVEGQPEKKLPAADKPLKKRLTVALSHYHPDKCDKTDRRRYFTCEEITKYLNNFYETTK